MSKTTRLKINGRVLKAEEGNDMKLDYEKYMKRLYTLLNGCLEPACITGEMASDIYENVADIQAREKVARNELGKERTKNNILTVALAEVYRLVYGYMPAGISEDMASIRSGDAGAITGIHNKCVEVLKDKERLNAQLIEIYNALYPDYLHRAPVDAHMAKEMCQSINELREKCDNPGRKEYEKRMKQLCALIHDYASAPSVMTDAMVTEMGLAVVKLRADRDEVINGNERLERYLSEIYNTVYGKPEHPVTMSVESVKEMCEHIEMLRAVKEPRDEDQKRLNASICEDRRRFEEVIKKIYKAVHGWRPEVVDDTSLLENLVKEVESLNKESERVRAPLHEGEVSKIKLEEAIIRIYESQYTDKFPSISQHTLDTVCQRVETITKRNKEALVKEGKLEGELAQLHNQTSGLRFAESRALEKRVEVWADKAIQYRSILSATARHLRDRADSLSVDDVKALADVIEGEMNTKNDEKE